MVNTRWQGLRDKDYCGWLSRIDFQSESAGCGHEREEEIDRLIQLNNEVQKMLNASIKTLRERQGSKSVLETPNSYTPNFSPLEGTEP